jgi:hypothetical protein
VLESLAAAALFALELAPDENRSPGGPAPLSDALGRCLMVGWVRTAPADSPDWRMHLTAAGAGELAWRVAEERQAAGTAT